MKKLRMILPALAILFAVAGTLATNASAGTTAPVEISFGPVSGQTCPIDGTCEPAGATRACYLDAGKSINQLFNEDSQCVVYNLDGEWTPD